MTSEKPFYLLVRCTCVLILPRDICTVWRMALKVVVVHLFSVFFGARGVSLLFCFEQPSNFWFSNSLVPPKMLISVMKHFIFSSVIYLTTLSSIYSFSLYLVFFFSYFFLALMHPVVHNQLRLLLYQIYWLSGFFPVQLSVQLSKLHRFRQQFSCMLPHSTTSTHCSLRKRFGIILSIQNRELKGVSTWLGRI